MALTKTQTALLFRAARHPHGVTSVISGFITSRRNSQYGVRESNAACKLRDMGYFEFVSTDKSVHHLCHGFGADHGHDTCWRITDAGRTFIQSL